MPFFKWRWLTFLFSFVQLGFVGWLDFATSYEISVTICYFIPISYAAWYLGWEWSFVFGLLSAGTLTWTEVAGGRHYSSGWIIGEVTLMRVLVFGFVAFSFNFFNRTIQKEKDKVRQLEGLLPVCTCCRKVRDAGGNWTDLEAYLRENTQVELQAKICPDCARSQYLENYPTDRGA